MIVLPEFSEKVIEHLEVIRRSSWIVSMLITISGSVASLILLFFLGLLSGFFIYLTLSFYSCLAFFQYRSMLVEHILDPFAKDSATLQALLDKETELAMQDDHPLVTGLVIVGCALLGPLVWMLAPNKEDVTALFGGIEGVNATAP